MSSMTHKSFAEDTNHKATFTFQVSNHGKLWTTVATGLSVDDAAKHAIRIHSNAPTATYEIRGYPLSAYYIATGLQHYRWRGDCEDCSAAEIYGYMVDNVGVK